MTASAKREVPLGTEVPYCPPHYREVLADGRQICKKCGDVLIVRRKGSEEEAAARLADGLGQWLREKAGAAS